MDMTEEKVYAAFGLEAPEQNPAPGENEQAPAEPAPVAEPAGTDTGENEQEPAAPAQEPENQETDHEGDGQAPAGQENAMSQEQRRENAARRRQQEQQAAIDAAVSKALQEQKEKNDAAWQSFFQRAQLKNTISGEPITSIDQFDAWKTEFDAQKLNSDLKAGKLTAEQLNQVIASHPAVRQAQTMIQAEETARQQRQQAEEQQRISAEIAEIGKLSAQIGGGTVTGIQDLLAMPKSEEFKGYVAKGYSFLDAYKLANMEALANAKAEAARRQAVNNARGKDHLNPIGSPIGNGAVSVPSEEMRIFRMMNPNATEAQIQEFYNKYKAKQGG